MKHLHNLFGFKGRLRRSDYWLYSAIVFAGLIACAAIPAAILGVDLANPNDLRAAGLQLMAVLLMMWPNLAVCAKRAHDRGQSGWWVLLAFLPVIGNIWMVVNLGIMRGTEGPNRYGPEPEREQFTLTDLWAAKPA